LTSFDQQHARDVQLLHAHVRRRDEVCEQILFDYSRPRRGFTSESTHNNV
jgi:hypothetical protein